MAAYGGGAGELGRVREVAGEVRAVVEGNAGPFIGGGKGEWLAGGWHRELTVMVAGMLGAWWRKVATGGGVMVALSSTGRGGSASSGAGVLRRRQRAGRGACVRGVAGRRSRRGRRGDEHKAVKAAGAALAQRAVEAV
jgi:hypothetical protein